MVTNPPQRYHDSDDPTGEPNERLVKPRKRLLRLFETTPFRMVVVWLLLLLLLIKLIVSKTRNSTK